MVARNGFNKDDITRFFEQGIDIGGRAIYIGSVESRSSEDDDPGVNYITAEYAIKGLYVLNRLDKGRITAILNTIGGDEFNGFAIYDAIRASPSPVDIVVYGNAMSMGAVILQAGRKRLLHPNSTLMIHDGTLNQTEMPVRSASNWTAFEKELCNRMYRIFAERSGQKPSYWKRKCTHDYILTPEEAIEQGLADKVILPKQTFIKPNTKRQ